MYVSATDPKYKFDNDRRGPETVFIRIVVELISRTYLANRLNFHADLVIAYGWCKSWRRHLITKCPSMKPVFLETFKPLRICGFWFAFKPTQ